MIEQDFFQQLNRFNFIVKKRISSVYAGSRKSIRYGKGIEVVDYREYFPGDDFRTIDWNIYCRTEKLHVRRYEEEKSATTHILIDTSKSMDFSTNHMTKYDYAAMIGLGFAYIVTNTNEKFALATYAERLRDILRPKRGRTHFFKAFDLLNGMCSGLQGKTDLSTAASSYIKMIRSKSFVVIVSDFLEDIGSIREGIYRMARFRNDLMVVHVADPGELDLKWSGDVKLHDLETAGVRKTYISPKFKKDYHKRLKEHLSMIEESCGDVGADFFSVRTDTPIFETFLELMEHKRM